jgi:hypothetical protein
MYVQLKPQGTQDKSILLRPSAAVKVGARHLFGRTPHGIWQNPRRLLARTLAWVEVEVAAAVPPAVQRGVMTTFGINQMMELQSGSQQSLTPRLGSRTETVLRHLEASVAHSGTDRMTATSGTTPRMTSCGMGLRRKLGTSGGTFAETVKGHIPMGMVPINLGMDVISRNLRLNGTILMTSPTGLLDLITSGEEVVAVAEGPRLPILARS